MQEHNHTLGTSYASVADRTLGKRTLESTTWHGHDGVCGIQLVHSLLGQDELETLEDLLSYLPHFPIACSHIVVLDNKQELNLALEVSFPSPARSSIPCLLLVSKMAHSSQGLLNNIIV